MPDIHVVKSCVFMCTPNVVRGMHRGRDVEEEEEEGEGQEEEETAVVWNSC